MDRKRQNCKEEEHKKPNERTSKLLEEGWMKAKESL